VTVVITQVYLEDGFVGHQKETRDDKQQSATSKPTTSDQSVTMPGPRIKVIYHSSVRKRKRNRDSRHRKTNAIDTNIEEKNMDATEVNSCRNSVDVDDNARSKPSSADLKTGNSETNTNQSKSLTEPNGREQLSCESTEKEDNADAKKFNFSYGIAQVEAGTKSDTSHMQSYDGTHNLTATVVRGKPDSVALKYWHQRKRLFSRFDFGIKLDSESWYSVTPEVIANHIASRIATKKLSCNDVEEIVVLDAFAGCGGNTIAFALHRGISKVVCVDTDKMKLQMLAHNASIYGVPTNKLLLIHGDTISIMEQLISRHKDGLKEREDVEEPSQLYNGYQVAVVENITFNISAIFLSPPWGGPGYIDHGPYSFDILKHINVESSTTPRVETDQVRPQNIIDNSTSQRCNASSQECLRDDESKSYTNEIVSKSTIPLSEENVIKTNGVELLKLASKITKEVVYFLPRNTNTTSLGRAAFRANYRGKIEFERVRLNGKLKTICAYMGEFAMQMSGDVSTKNLTSNDCAGVDIT